MSGTSIIAQIFRSLMHVPLWCDFFKISYAPCNVGFVKPDFVACEQ